MNRTFRHATLSTVCAAVGVEQWDKRHGDLLLIFHLMGVDHEVALVLSHLRQGTVFEKRKENVIMDLYVVLSDVTLPTISYRSLHKLELMPKQ